jgi:hypothetical protein
MNLIKKLSSDLKEYFKPENVKARLKSEIEMDKLKIEREKIRIEKDKLTKERWENKPKFKLGME